MRRWLQEEARKEWDQLIVHFGLREPAKDDIVRELTNVPPNQLLLLRAGRR